MANNVRLPLLPVPALGSSESGDAVANAVDDNELMQVGDLAREAQKTVRALHLYEELQLLRPTARSKGRYRLYGREALVRIRWIGKLQDMGFSLTDIQTIVKDWEESSSAPRTMVKMRELYTKKLEETQAHLRKMHLLEHDLRASLDYLDTCEECDPARLLSACTSCDLHDCESHVPDLIAGFRAN
jgi:MerR family transcriptional regulator, copper efflux regulator